MKKVISLILAIMMVATLAVNCFAADNAKITAVGAPGASATVTGTYVEGTEGVEYSVDVVWGSLNFTFNATGKSWNDVKHIWEDVAEGSWSEDQTVTVTNHSSKEVTVNATATGEVEVALPEEKTIAAPVENGAAFDLEFTVGVKDSFKPVSTTDLTAIGTVTVEIA